MASVWSSSEAEVREMLKDAEEEEAALLDSLARLLESSDTLELMAEDLELMPQRLKPVLDSAQQLQEVLDGASLLAHKASGKVKQLDRVRERVTHTLQQVRDTMEVQECVEGVTRAIAEQQWEVAARHLQRYRSIDADVLEEASVAALEDATQQLQRVFDAQIGKAEEAGDLQSAVHYCSLLSMIGSREAGLTIYVTSLRRQLQKLGKDALLDLQRVLDSKGERVAGGGVSSSCVKSLTTLFQEVAALVNEHVPVCDERFGVESRIELLRVVEAECAVHGCAVIEKFAKERELESTVRVVKGSGTPDPRSLVDTLDCCVLLSHRVVFYQRFLHKLGAESVSISATERPEEAESGEWSKEHGLLRSSALDRSVEQVLAHYIVIEDYFLMQSVQRAIELDEDNSDGMTSRMVDYVFFILQKSGVRSLNSANVDACCAVLNNINSCLEEFLGVMQNILTETALQMQRAKSDEMGYGIVLNNLKVSSDFILRLCSDLEKTSQRVFTESKAIAKLNSCWHDMRDKAKTFRSVLKSNLAQVASTMEPRVREIAKKLDWAEYELDEARFARLEMEGNAAVETYVRSMEELLAPFAKALQPANLDTLIHLILQGAVARLEARIKQGKFNALGALQLSKDVATIAKYFTSLTPSIRADMQRINQILMIVGVERLADAQDMYAGSTFRLTPSDVRRILSRRAEFQASAIAKLAL